MSVSLRPSGSLGGLREFVQALRTQMRVIGALVLRELHTRFGRHHGGYVWLFFEPMLLASSIAALHGVMGHGMPGNMNVIGFYLTGYTPYYLFRGILNRSAGALFANAPLFYHKQVSYLDVIISRNLLEIVAVLFAQFVLLYVVAAFNGQFPVHPAQIATGVVLMGLFCHGISMTITSATVVGIEEVDRVIHPMTYLMIPMVGAFTMVWWFPSDFQEIMLLNPTIHMFEYIREGHFGPIVPFHYDLAYIIKAVAITNVFGLFCLKAAGHKYPYLSDG